MTMADTVAVMNKGEIEQQGAPQVLYELPRTAFVANFLGQSNLFTGDVSTTTSNSIKVSIEGSTITVPKKRAQRHSGEVTVGVRPEKVRLHVEEPKFDPEMNMLGPGRIVDVSFSGVSTQYLVAIPGMGVLTVFSQNMSFGPIAHEGAEVWVSWLIDHGFGLEDEIRPGPRFPADTDTATIAVQKKRALMSELEES